MATLPKAMFHQNGFGKNSEASEEQVPSFGRRPQRMRKREDVFEGHSKTDFGKNTIANGKALTVQELYAKREDQIRREVEKIQNESKMMMDRHMQEAQRRTDLIQQEEEMRAREENRKQELMEQRMLEYKLKEKARKDELRRQESLLNQEHIKAEVEAKRRQEEAKFMEEKRLALEKARQEMENRAETQRIKSEQRKVLEAQREKEHKAEEEIRRREMERLLKMKNREEEIMLQRQAEVNNVSDAELKYSTPSEWRPGELRGYGFGNVRTGQVSSKKMNFLMRALSAGPESSRGLSRDGSRSTISARASPMSTAAQTNGHRPGQWTQQSPTIARTDFASSTKALGSGLSRRSGMKA